MSVQFEVVSGQSLLEQKTSISFLGLGLPPPPQPLAISNEKLKEKKISSFGFGTTEAWSGSSRQITIKQSKVILNLVVCILLRVLDQVQGFRLTQHCFIVVYYFIQ
jgi:hypothetical protein